MQVSIETTGELQRRLTVEVPAEQVEQEVATRLHSLAQRVRIDGFRPGKVPLKVVVQRYGDKVRDEVTDEVVQRSLGDALRQENLHPAGGPRIESREVIPGASLRFTVVLEIFPDVQLASLDDLTLECPTAQVTDQDVDELLETLRRQRRAWEPVQRAACDGDRLVIDYQGTIDGAPLPGGSAESVSAELGSGRLLDAFEEQLRGLKPGDRAAFDVSYPAEHPKAEVAGKTVHYTILVHSVSESHMPALDEDFARGFGVTEGGVDALRIEVRANMERELARAIRGRLKDQVMSALLARNPVTVPDTLMREEVERLQAQAAESGDSTKGVSGPEDLESAARRRVGLGLIIAELVRVNGIAVDPVRVRAAVEGIAASYENPDEVVQWYYGDRGLLSGVESMVLEDQVVDWVAERAGVREVPGTFRELTHSAAE
ncbi:trigger factor [bacterium BMS3Bbin12]|nr:trigger factor [bacterium BMS3Bbin12]GBE50118.1 trigger factor [bacterium BMS3Bbin13]HDJ86658.1 trigger factor [Chromatiales bacterium]HDK02482.1 trigger factor [Gammaproteobacteria bacterium]